MSLPRKLLVAELTLPLLDLIMNCHDMTAQIGFRSKSPIAKVTLEVPDALMDSPYVLVQRANVGIELAAAMTSQLLFQILRLDVFWQWFLNVVDHVIPFDKRFVNGFNVSLQVAFQSEAFPAIDALKVFDVFVDILNVLHQVAFQAKTLATRLALEILGLLVDVSHVPFHDNLLTERLVANLTLEVLHILVDASPVGRQVAFEAELLPASLTLESFDVFVNRLHVSGQVALLAESLVADVTRELLLLGTDAGGIVVVRWTVVHHGLLFVERNRLHQTGGAVQGESHPGSKRSVGMTRIGIGVEVIQGCWIQPGIMRNRVFHDCFNTNSLFQLMDLPVRPF